MMIDARECVVLRPLYRERSQGTERIGTSVTQYNKEGDEQAVNPEKLFRTIAGMLDAMYLQHALQPGSIEALLLLFWRAATRMADRLSETSEGQGTIITKSLGEIVEEIGLNFAEEIGKQIPVVTSPDSTECDA